MDSISKKKSCVLGRSKWNRPQYHEVPQACNFIKKETLAQVFSGEFCEISKNTFFYKAPLDDCFWTNTVKRIPKRYLVQNVPIQSNFINLYLLGSILVRCICNKPATLLKKRLWHRCFPVNIAKFLRTPFLTEHLRWLLLFSYSVVFIIGFEQVNKDGAHT